MEGVDKGFRYKLVVPEDADVGASFSAADVEFASLMCRLFSARENVWMRMHGSNRATHVMN
jgi:hypothetical protein